MNTHSQITNIETYAYYLRIALQVTFVAVVIIFCISWLAAITGYTAMNHPTLGFTIAFSNVVMNLLILYFLIRLFSAYEKNKIFTFANMRLIKNIGYAILAKTLALPLFQFAIAYILSAYIQIVDIYIANIAMILVGFMVVINAWIFQQATVMDQEQKLTI